MRIKYDKNNDTVYFRLDENKISESEEISDGVILDYNENNKVIGVEFLEVSKRVSLQELIDVRVQTV